MLKLLRPTLLACYARPMRALSSTPRRSSTSELDNTIDPSDALNDLLLEVQTLTPSTSATQSTIAQKSPFENQQPSLSIPPADDPLLSYFTSSIMHNGHRHRAAQITSRVPLHIHAFTRSPPLPILREAIRLASPSVRVVTGKRGGKSTFRPTALSEKQRTRFAMQWILAASENKAGRRLEERLARELIAVVKGDSEVFKKKSEVHRMAMVNRGTIKA